ncbi:response regulator [Mariprofundus sp. EBB-1]|nr:response regulator [Mariprofundus sp. EBB-1]
MWGVCNMHNETSAKESLEIILIDDDKEVLKVHHKMVNLIGHAVVSFRSASDAIHYLKTAHEQIDLIITDLHMPEMNGAELLDHIRTLGIKTPAIILTGHPNDVNLLQIEIDQTMVITKPVRMKALAEHIASMQLSCVTA